MNVTPLREAKNFSLVTGSLMEDALATSLRDFRLRVRLPTFRPWSPGQFVMVRWGNHTLARPFAIVDWQADPQGGESILSLWVRRLGPGTEDLFRVAKRGLEVHLTLPLGQGLAVAKNSERILFLSGGVGAASIFPIRKLRVDLGLGEKDHWIHGERDFASLDREWFKAGSALHAREFFFDAGTRELDEADKRFVEENQLGARLHYGRITQAFEGSLAMPLQKPFDAIVACGPSGMLESLASKIATRRELVKTPVYIGLEEKMACGIGLCFSCSVSTSSGLNRCCLEGPWFDQSQLMDHFSFRKTGKIG